MHGHVSPGVAAGPTSQFISRAQQMPISTATGSDMQQAWHSCTVRDAESIRGLCAAATGYLENVRQGLPRVLLSPGGVAELEEAVATAASSAHHSLRTTNPKVACLTDWALPTELLTQDDTGIQEAAAAVLEQLGEQCEQRARGVVEATLAADAAYKKALAALATRADNSRSLLLQLPPEVLRTIARAAGDASRLACSHLYHAYGSPATHLTPSPHTLPEILARLHRWPAPWEVQSFVCPHATLPPVALAALLAAFTRLNALHLAAAPDADAAHSYQDLPRTLTSLHLNTIAPLPPKHAHPAPHHPVPAPNHPLPLQPPPLDLASLSHLTLLQSLTLCGVQPHPASLHPLRALRGLTHLRLSAAPRADPEPADEPTPAMPVAPVPPEAWGAFCALPRLQHLQLEGPLDLSSAPLPADATGLGALTQLAIDCYYEAAAMGQPHLIQVLQLLPETCVLRLTSFERPLAACPVTGAPLLQQAFASMPCRHLQLSGEQPPAGLPHLLLPACPALHSLSLTFAHFPDMHATACRLLHLPLPALQSLALRWEYPTPAAALSPAAAPALLDALAGGLPGLTHLDIGAPDAAGPVPNWATAGDSLTRLTALRSLALHGFTLCALAAGALPRLPALTQLSLSVHSNRANPRRTCLPRACASISQLTGLASLSLGSARVASQPTELPQAASASGCILPLVRRLTALERLALGGDRPPSMVDVSTLLPLRPALRTVALHYPYRGHREQVTDTGAFHCWAYAMWRGLEGAQVDLQLTCGPARGWRPAQRVAL